MAQSKRSYSILASASRRKIIIMCGLLGAVACTPPPHPTHPTKIDCPYQVQTTFSARIDNSFDTTNAGEDPCTSPGGAVLLDTWDQLDTFSSPICVMPSTTPEQAATFCTNHLAATGIRVGGPAAPPPAVHPSARRICPGSDIVLAVRVTAIGGASAPQVEGCREGTTWPLLP